MRCPNCDTGILQEIGSVVVTVDGDARTSGTETGYGCDGGCGYVEWRA
jgi:hypothetical protein